MGIIVGDKEIMPIPRNWKGPAACFAVFESYTTDILVMLRVSEVAKNPNSQSIYLSFKKSKMILADFLKQCSGNHISSKQFACKNKVRFCTYPSLLLALQLETVKSS